MSELTKSLLAELEQETASTRHILEGIPKDKFDWKPTEVAMTLGELAHHIATTPKAFANMLSQDDLDVSTINFGERPTVTSTDEVIQTLESAIGETTKILSEWKDDYASATFRFTEGDKELMAAPRVAIFRTLGMNHMYHHRGQLSTYLRLLGGPVPAVYGPSADDNPFA